MLPCQTGCKISAGKSHIVHARSVFTEVPMIHMDENRNRDNNSSPERPLGLMKTTVLALHMFHSHSVSSVIGP